MKYYPSVKQSNFRVLTQIFDCPQNTHTIQAMPAIGASPIAM